MVASVKTRVTAATAVALCIVMALLTPVQAAPPSPAPPVRVTIPDVLNVAPADAQVVVVMPNIGQVSKKLADFNKAVNLNIPELGDVLGMLKREAGIEKGLDDHGSVMFVVTSLKTAIESGGEPKIAIVVPVTDYKAFIANYKGTEKDGVTELTLPDGESAYARSVGNYAVMGPDADGIKQYKAGNGKARIAASVGRVGAAALSTSDLAVYVNVESLGPLVRPKLAEMRQSLGQMFGGAGGGGQGPEAEMMAMAKTFMDIYFDSIDAVLRDTSGAVFGADLDSKGVGLTCAAQFKPDSYLARVFRGGAPRASSLLANVPDQPFIFAGTVDMGAIDVKSLIGTLEAKLPKTGGGWLADVIHAAAPLATLPKSAAQVLYAPAKGAGLFGGLGGMAIVEADDPAAYVKANRDYMTAMGKIKMDFGKDPDGNPMVFGFTSKYQANAIEGGVDGAQVDQYSLAVNIPPALLKEMGQMGPIMATMMNQAGYVARTDKHVILTTQPDIDLLRKGLAAAKSGKGLGANDLIAATRKAGLPRNLAVEGYLNLGGVIEMVNPVIQLFGGPKIDVPNNLPPLAMGAGVEDGGVTGRLYVPMPLVQWGVSTVKQLMQMGGPGGPGNGPPPAPF